MLALRRSQPRKGKTAKKILLLLIGGVALGFAFSPTQQMKLLKGIAKEWEKLNRHELYRAIRRLYESRLIRYREHTDGSVEIVLTGSGKERALRYKLEDMHIPKPERWDGLWRLVIFDVPEKRENLRDTLRRQLKRIGFLELQKSVFVHPYDCRDEIDFIVELFGARPYVRFITANFIDNELHLKKRFRFI